MNWFKKVSQVYGEYWINENGDIMDAEGEYDHSSYVRNHIIKKYFNNSNISEILKKDDNDLLNSGLTQEEIDIIKDKEDPRVYAMKNWGWIRIQDKYAQMWNITFNTLKNLSKGLQEAFGFDVFKEKFEVESLRLNKVYSSVPYDVIMAGKPSALRYYEYGAIAKNKNKFEKISNNQLTFNTKTTGFPYYDGVMDEKLMTYYDHTIGEQTEIPVKEYLKRAKGISGHIEYMSPDEYLRRCAKGIAFLEGSENIDKYMKQMLEFRNNPELLEDYKQRWLGGSNPPMPFILYYNGQYSSQEGIHRVLVAKSLGVDSVPVLIVDENR